jgi:acyl dehydratase
MFAKTSRTTALLLAGPLLAVGAVGFAAAPAQAGSVTCSFTSTATAPVSSVTMPNPVKAGSTVSATVKITRLAGDANRNVEVHLAPSSWTRTDVCVIVPSGKTSASFNVTISPVTRTGETATVGAYATSSGSDAKFASSSIVLK